MLAGARLAREEHDGCAVGDLAAILLADAAFDRRVGALILREAAFVECPAARLRVAIAAPVGEVDLRDARQVLLLQAEAAVVFVGDVAEYARPRIARFLIFVAGPHRGPADVLRCLLARHIAHLLDAQHCREPVPPRFDIR